MKMIKHVSAREQEATKKLFDELNEPLDGPIDNSSGSGKCLKHYFIFICNKIRVYVSVFLLVSTPCFVVVCKSASVYVLYFYTFMKSS